MKYRSRLPFSSLVARRLAGTDQATTSGPSLLINMLLRGPLLLLSLVVAGCSRSAESPAEAPVPTPASWIWSARAAYASQMAPAQADCARLLSAKRYMAWRRCLLQPRRMLTLWMRPDW